MKFEIHLDWARVEHVFGFMEGSMNTMKLKQIGKDRIEGAIGMMNLVYNMFRKVQLQAISQETYVKKTKPQNNKILIIKYLMD